MAIILGRKPGGSGGGGGAPSGPAGGDLAGTYPNPTIDPTAAVISINGTGGALAGAVTLSEGSGINLTQVGQDIEIAATGGSALFASYAYLRDQQPQGTQGGTFTQDAWRTRVLNTEVFDPDGIVSLASNQFTLQAGTYYIVGRAPAFFVEAHKVRLFDITNNALVADGTSARAGAPNMDNYSDVRARVTIAGATVYELQHYCRQTCATNGLGVACDIPGTGDETLEVYAEVVIYKEA